MNRRDCDWTTNSLVTTRRRNVGACDAELLGACRQTHVSEMRPALAHHRHTKYRYLPYLPMPDLQFLSQDQIDQVIIQPSILTSPLIPSSAQVSPRWVGDLKSLSHPPTFAKTPPLFFNRCLLIPNFLSDNDIQEMMARSKQLLDDFTLHGHPMVRPRRSFVISPPSVPHDYDNPRHHEIFLLTR